MKHVSRFVGTALAAAGLVLAAGGAPALAAPKGTPGAVETYQNTAYGTCLDSNAKGKVYLMACNDGNFQKWTPTAGGPNDSYRMFKNVATGLCLKTDSARNVTTVPCSTREAAQQWEIGRRDGQQLQFHSVGVAGQCLDAYQGTVLSSPCHTGAHDAYQYWT